MAKSNNIETKAIHAGRINDEQFGSLATPLYQTSTFIFENAQQGADRFAGEEEGFIYSRLGNPTTRQLEMRVAAMEGMEDAAATATGMGAVSGALLSYLQAGDHMIASKAIYGCSYALISHMLTRFGIEVTFVDMTDMDAFRQAIKANTKLVFLETPINPNMVVLDLDAISNIAKEHDLISVVDNTFLTPILQQPREFGIDIVVHSATKYLNGHGDVVAGIICGTSEMINHIKMTVLKDIGATMSPHDAWLILRGIKTLPIRMERHCRNAQSVAEFLEENKHVTKVHYPGLKSHSGNTFIGKQMKAAGGVIAFELDTDLAGGAAFINSMKLFSIAVSLGDAESLIQHPASMTHSPYTQEERLDAGISDGLIRISVGLEHEDDLIADLKQALDLIDTRLNLVGKNHQQNVA
ncbi:methionine gamma-lyase [Marinomonas sp. SBI22]|uniref:methionine gamma-lyase n=1 Tax=unclassified Marinomonas TaxID=196814 RepID=UPI0007AF4793|nr:MULTISPECIES: methionine gamma-lyase [unclassified Marinomonas]KZM44904.1 methionine gamma-lyase [Marinomonas sp. SBI22]KZM46603.1 methionine gamma-lyase [Marinomonas sp. SBI8L]